MIFRELLTPRRSIRPNVNKGNRLYQPGRSDRNAQANWFSGGLKGSANLKGLLGITEEGTNLASWSITWCRFRQLFSKRRVFIRKFIARWYLFKGVKQASAFCHAQSSSTVDLRSFKRSDNIRSALQNLESEEAALSGKMHLYWSKAAAGLDLSQPFVSGFRTASFTCHCPSLGEKIYY